MGSVCHHGIPLFHVSLWTPREEQFYTFALLSMLLEHLPNSWKVGCLYDIGCQIHHAVHKWDFALERRECLSWGVSIFHAYGHQWACQLWYHPCKDALWGLSDGEGCERFWSELHHLISGLHVTGYHHHLLCLTCKLSVTAGDRLCHMSHLSRLRDRFRPIFGNPVEVTHVTS